MIRQFACAVLFVLAVGWLPLSSHAESYRLRTGELIEATPAHFNADGVVFRRADNSFTPRASWTNFTDEALKQLADFPESKPFVDDHIIEEVVPEEDTAEQQIKPRPVPRLERLPASGGLAGLFRSPLSLTLVLLIYLANIYAGYEVAIFRNYPVWLVALAAAILPFIGPIVFLCLPTYVPAPPEPVYEPPPDSHSQHSQHSQTTEAEPGAAPAHEPAPTQPQAPAGPTSVVYQRGTTTFNRRFFETKLAGFMRTVPSEEDKDMVLLVKSVRGDHTASRISRVTPNELEILINKGGASANVTIPFTELREVKVCHKSALEKA